ncbi:hypothetical protein T484DRAFT_1768408 [Baffinella frigidus]|nr:hypothetical protein T484DRAFT_1768408 [Cryptophyta sp. CCMP2293]
MPDWKKFAEAVGPSIKVDCDKEKELSVDCDKEKELAGKYKVEGFPTIKFFGVD